MPQKLTRASKYIAWIVMLIGASTLAGWITGNTWLTTWVLSGITMKPNTAMGLLLAAVALLLLLPSRPAGDWRLWVGRALSVTVTALGLFSALEYVVHADL